jgi:hypothetical protein
MIIGKKRYINVIYAMNGLKIKFIDIDIIILYYFFILFVLEYLN